MAIVTGTVGGDDAKINRREISDYDIDEFINSKVGEKEDAAMKIVDLTKEYEKLYCQCLEDWSDEMAEAGDTKTCWYQKMKGRGLRVKLALDENGTVGGMIQYAPIEHTFVRGEGLYFIYCIWIHGHPRGRGNFQKRGMGTALIKAAEDDARSLGAGGMAAWGIVLPFWMKASWFRKKGYRRADRDGMAALLWKPFTDEARPPRWTRRRKRPEPGTGKVNVTAFVNGWCPAQNLAFERARRAASEFGDLVEFRVIDTFNGDAFKEWGIADALFIDGKEVRTGPPPSFEKIRTLIARRAGRMRT